MPELKDYAPTLLFTGAALAIAHAAYVRFLTPPVEMTHRHMQWWIVQDTWPVVALGAGCLLVGLFLLDR